MARTGFPGFAASDVAAATVGAGGITATELNTAAVTTVKIADANVTLAKLATGITPAFIVVKGGYVALPNAAATSDVTLSGLISTDIVIVSPSVMGTKATTLQGLYKSATAITITSSANTATGDIAFYLVLRAAA